MMQDRAAARRLTETDPFKRMERYLSRGDELGMAGGLPPMMQTQDIDCLSPGETGMAQAGECGQAFERMQHYLLRAVEMGLTDGPKVEMMTRNVADGSFTAAHYAKLWSKRVKCAEEAAAAKALLGSIAWSHTDETSSALRDVLVEAVSLELADRQAVKTMLAHIESGAFTEAYYLAMWSQRVRECKETAVVMRASLRASERELKQLRARASRVSQLSYDTVSESSSDEGQ